MNKLKTIFSARKIAIFLMVAISALVLVACGTTTKVPYGSLGNDAYITISGKTVTEKELYDQLRTSAIGRLNTYIDEIVFADVVIDATNLSDFEIKAFEQEINTALFSSATITPEQLNDFPDKTLAQRILSFVDSFVITNPGVDKATLVQFLDAVVADVIARGQAVDFDKDAPFVFGYVDIEGYSAYTSIIEALVLQYQLPVQKKVYAKGLLGDVVGEGLEGDINDEDSSAYISEANAVTYYKNNLAGRYDTSALIIKFASVLEYETALRKHSIKSNSRGEWYRLPNIADQDLIDILKAGDTHPEWDNAGYHQNALDILVNDLKLEQATLETIDYRDPDFATYYSKYVINSTRDASLLLDDAPGNNQVLQVFLEIYDELHDSTFAVDYDVNQAADLETLATLFNMEYTDARFNASAELRNTIYNMDSNVLYNGGDGVDEDDVPYAKPYSRQVQSVGGSQYLLFLFEDDRAEDKDVIDETDSDDVKFLDNANAQALRAKALEKLVEQRLTSTYVTSKVTEKFEDVKVNIYDPVIRELYKNQNDYTGSEGFKDNNTLLDVNGTTLSVDSFFAKIEETLGLSTALDIIFIQKLREDYGDQITSDDMKDFRTQFETQYVNPFLANQYESAGFPASMGIDLFLLNGFGAWAHNGMSATEDALDKVYVQQELRTLFQEDLEVHFGGNTAADNIYARFAALANNIQANDVAIDASHLLFEIDLDNDGKADNPNDLDAAKLAELELLIAELIIEVNKRAALASSITEGLQNVVQAYNNSTRYILTTAVYPGPGATQDEIDEYINGVNREDVWVRFRKAGIRLLYQELGSISNTTNFPSSEGSLDEDFYQYAINMANYIKDEVTALDGQGEAPTQEEMTRRANALVPMYSPAFIASDVKLESDGNAAVRTSFGWHLVIAKSYVHQSSAALEAIGDTQKSEYTSKLDNPYVADTKVVGFNNDNSQITWEQLYIYIEESKEETGIITLPNALQTTISKYFGSIYSENTYHSSYAQLEIAFLYIFDGNIQLSDATQNTKLQILRDSNLNQFYNYAYFKGVDGTGNTIYDRAYNESYAQSYGQYFERLQGLV